MSATAEHGVGFGVNRIRSLSSAQAQEDFFDRLARLQSDVVSGKLPQYALPANTVAALSQLSLPKEDAANSPQPLRGQGTIVNGVSPANITQSKADNVRLVSPPKFPHSDRQAASFAAFDPVLLGKSDVLVRAEFSNKRQRIEKTLHELVESKRRVPNAVEPWDGPNVFDASQVLSAALCFEKPARDRVGDAAYGVASSTSSDEKSYYSSLVDSRSPDLEEGTTAFEKTQAQSQGNKVAVKRSLEQPAKPPGMISTVTPILSTASHSQCILSPVKGNGDGSCRGWKMPTNTVSSSEVTNAKRRTSGDIREDSYSPPPVAPVPQLRQTSKHEDIENIAPRGPRAMLTGQKPADMVIDDRSAKLRRSESYSPPSPSLPAVRAQPVNADAPNPPKLASSTVNQQEQKRKNGQRANVQHPPKKQGPSEKGRQFRQNGQPKPKDGKAPAAKSSGPPQNTQNSRKRRREDNNVEKDRRVSRNAIAQAAGSPEAYIKPEPVSPPLNGQASNGPQHSEAPQRLVIRDNGRVEMEAFPARNSNEPAYNHSAILGSAIPSSRNLSSRSQLLTDRDLSSPLPTRLNAPEDLRRVASVRHAQLPTPLNDQYVPNDGCFPQPLRYPVAYMPGPQRSLQYHQEMGRPGLRYFEETYSPGYDGTQEIIHERPGTGASTQAPKRQKVIIDENGDEWIAVPARPQPAMREAAYVQRPSHMQEPTYVSTYPRAASQMIERPARVYNQPKVIDLEADDYISMPPPSSRPVAFSGAENSWQHPIQYDHHVQSRATSVMPGDQYNVLRGQRFANGEPASLTGQSYSARPSFAQPIRTFRSQL